MLKQEPIYWKSPRPTEPFPDKRCPEIANTGIWQHMTADEWYCSNRAYSAVRSSRKKEVAVMDELKLKFLIRYQIVVYDKLF